MKNKVIIENLDKDDGPKIFSVKKNEHLTLVLVANNSVNYSTQVQLTEEGAEADILGIILGNDNHMVRLNTLQDHQAPNTTSNLLIKSALSGRSQLFYEGFIRVQKNAQRTNAYQRNENLMLSKEAKAESKPALEILANDVRCTHSATMGKVDKEQLFYLESRGLETKNATSLIVQGFFQNILDRIEDETVKDKIVMTITSLTN